MQPVKLTISGEYWDSQIYAGRLYLFGLSGDIITLDWDKLFEVFGIEEELILAASAAFQRSDLFYDSKRELFQDREIKQIILKKFDQLAERDLTIPNVESLNPKHQDNKFPFPHTDSQIYRKTLYVSSQSGVYSATCDKKTKNKHPVSTRTQKKWDAPVVAMSASYGCLALAAGSDGLFEMSLFHEAEPENLSNQNCIDCNWTFYSIYGSSHIRSGYLADFEKENYFDFEKENRFYERRFRSLISEDTIFHGSGYSWGVHDKLCQARNGCVHIVRYKPWKKPDSELEYIGSLNLAQWKGQVVSGKVASFGVIIECENAIVVLPSDDGDAITFPGEPVNWRIFPRSKHYENQLHIIYEDRIEIISFNHDYFVNQELKRAGIKVFQPN